MGDGGATRGITGSDLRQTGYEIFSLTVPRQGILRPTTKEGGGRPRLGQGFDAKVGETIEREAVLWRWSAYTTRLLLPRTTPW